MCVCVVGGTGRFFSNSDELCPVAHWHADKASDATAEERIGPGKETGRNKHWDSVGARTEPTYYTVLGKRH